MGLDKGIRPESNRKFMELLPRRKEMGNTPFRKEVIAHLMTEFDCSLASAATHYNHSFITAREAAKTNEELQQLLEGLGRPEDKKGGRKPKVVPAVTAAPAQQEEAAETAPQEVVGDMAQIDVEEPVQTEFTVKKSKDGSVIAEKLSYDDARELVAAAAKAKKAKLYWI